MDELPICQRLRDAANDIESGDPDACLKAAALIRALTKAGDEYIAECDNPAPDYSYRHLLRERLRAALAQAREG